MKKSVLKYPSIVKIVMILILIFFTLSIQSQTYVKLNVLPALVLVPNVGFETSIGKNATFQFDVTASFWNSIDGNPAEFFIFIPEYRYYFKEKFKGWYAGSNIGGTIFKVRKWTNLETNQYQQGFGYVVGITLGFQKKLTSNCNLDFFLGGGIHEGFYKGYNQDGTRYDFATNYNKSAEWLPYRGGIMLSYRLK